MLTASRWTSRITLEEYHAYHGDRLDIDKLLKCLVDGQQWLEVVYERGPVVRCVYPPSTIRQWGFEVSER